MKQASKYFSASVVLLFFGAIAVYVFTFSLKKDSFVHLLKNAYKTDLSGIDNEFVGFQAMVDPSVKDLYTSFANGPVIFYHLIYQEYICRKDSDGDERCSWETYLTSIDFVSDSLRVNSSGNTYEIILAKNEQRGFNPDDVFIPKNQKTYSLSKNRRVISSVIHKNEPVFIWGLLKDNQIQHYIDNTENENNIPITNSAGRTLSDQLIEILTYPFNMVQNDYILFITDSAERTLQDMIMDILTYQFASALIFILSIIIVYRLQKDKKVKTYVVPFINKTI